MAFKVIVLDLVNMKAFSVSGTVVEEVDENEVEPDGWIDGNGTVRFNSIDGGYDYTSEELRAVADFADKQSFS